jgi:SAM-dependent methyltransferase
MSSKSFESREEALPFLSRFLTENLEKIQKITFSKPVCQTILRAQAKPIRISGEVVWQVETFTSDQKALHTNLPLQEAVDRLVRDGLFQFLQVNIVFTLGNAEWKISNKGKVIFLSHLSSQAEKATVASHNQEKQYLLNAKEHPEFLHLLDVCDEKGRVYDRKSAKYKQINRFLELLDDIYPKLPSEGKLTVCDLCCGKSYLTFAVYYYLTALKNREVSLYGVDLKADVMAYCQSVAEKLNWKGITFLCQDILTFKPQDQVDLVVSLHACDTATDIVLAYAIQTKAKVILSTPCCHHEVFHQLSGAGCRTTHPPLSSKPIQKEKAVAGEFDFLTKHSILKQKFCDALTDSLRALRLEAEGYRVEALELIDPEETPKNVMLRAVYTGRKNGAALLQYREAVSRFGLHPTLDDLLNRASGESEKASSRMKK